jgi:hypothetical protein
MIYNVVSSSLQRQWLVNNELHMLWKWSWPNTVAFSCTHWILFYQINPDFQNSISLWKVPSLNMFVVSVRATSRFRWEWSIGGMILTRQNRNTRRKTCPSATLSTTNLTRADLGTIPGLHDEIPATSPLIHVKKVKQSHYRPGVAQTVPGS